MVQNFQVILIFWNFRPTLGGTRQTFRMKFRKMSVPFVPPTGISGIFGSMKSTHRLLHLDPPRVQFLVPTNGSMASGKKNVLHTTVTAKLHVIWALKRTMQM